VTTPLILQGEVYEKAEPHDGMADNGRMEAGRRAIGAHPPSPALPPSRPPGRIRALSCLAGMLVSGETRSP